MENSVITLNESNFDRELTQDDKPMIVDFWAEWCGPCKMIAPLLDEIAREKTGTLKIAKVNVDENQSLSAKYNIRAIPALLFFKNGQLRDQVIGVASKKDLLSRLENWQRHPGLAELKRDDRRLLASQFTRLVRDARGVANLIDDFWPSELLDEAS